jgi:hypothetical protein
MLRGVMYERAVANASMPLERQQGVLELDWLDSSGAKLDER